MKKLHLYYGNGKGKTTAAMGLALRALGHHQRVLVAQFMKSGTSGELEALRTFGSTVVYPSTPVNGFVFNMTPKEKAAVHDGQTRMTRELTAFILREKPETVILDELSAAWQLGMVDDEAARALVSASLTCAETVVTGYQAVPWLLEHADYISHLEAQRHPFATEGLQAREGVEW